VLCSHCGARPTACVVRRRSRVRARVRRPLRGHAPRRRGNRRKRGGWRDATKRLERGRCRQRHRRRKRGHRSGRRGPVDSAHLPPSRGVRTVQRVLRALRLRSGDPRLQDLRIRRLRRQRKQLPDRGRVRSGVRFRVRPLRPHLARRRLSVQRRERLRVRLLFERHLRAHARRLPRLSPLTHRRLHGRRSRVLHLPDSGRRRVLRALISGAGTLPYGCSALPSQSGYVRLRNATTSWLNGGGFRSLQNDSG
jgi:hypothetical protein